MMSSWLLEAVLAVWHDLVVARVLGVGGGNGVAAGSLDASEARGGAIDTSGSYMSHRRREGVAYAHDGLSP
jgi:hypothetical protein